jgi:hypothetical protein
MTVPLSEMMMELMMASLMVPLFEMMMDLQLSMMMEM